MDEVSGPIIAIALVLVRGVRADRVHQRADRPVLPAVRADDRDLDGHLRVQLADAEPRPCLAAAVAARRAEGSRCSAWPTACLAGSSAGSTGFSPARPRHTPTASRALLRLSVAVLVLYGGLVGLTCLGFSRVPQGFIPTQDKDYLVAFAQLPDAATLDRTDAVIRKMSDLALQQPGVANAVEFPGLSVNGFVNASNAGISFVTLKPAKERAGHPELSAAAIVAGAQRTVRRDPGGVRRDLSAAAGAGSGHGRRLQALRRGPRRHRVRGAVRADTERDWRGHHEAQPGGPLLQLPGQRAADRRARRSRARQDLRRAADRGVRHAAGLPRVALRERLQPLRPHLPGQRPGRVGFPSAARADPPAARRGTPTERWCRSDRWCRSRRATDPRR